MDDLVRRLRSVPPCNGCGEYPGGDIAQIMDIAADRIEQLEAQLAKAEEALHYIGYKSQPIDFTAEQLRLHARMALDKYREKE